MTIQISPVMPVTPSDVGAIAALARIVWAKTYADIITPAQINHMLDDRYNAIRLTTELQSENIWWDKVEATEADESDESVGELIAFAATFLTDTPGEMKLDKLYVHPARQAMGIGGRLITHVAERALKKGCHRLILAVNKKNEQAIGAYKKHGFVIREAVCVSIGNGFVMDDFIMEKPLTARSLSDLKNRSENSAG